MTLVEVRQKLVELSGAYNLVSDFPAGNFSDSGANFFIQSGQRWLDSLLETPQSLSEFEVSFQSGEFQKTVSEARGIEGVRYEETNEGIRFLNKLTWVELVKKWAFDKTLSEVDRGKPIDYSIGIQRKINLTGQHSGETGKKLIIMPPADSSFTLVVEGLFFSQTLLLDTDDNWWSINYPDILIQAALFKRETFLRNTSGANDWRVAVIDAVDKINMDLAYENVSNIDQMQDSWNFRKHIINRGRNEF